MTVDNNFLLVITSCELGSGEADLGAKLTGAFFKVFSESEKPPARIIFMNSGVFLTTEGSPVAEQLQALEKCGTEIVSCTTCLNYFDRMDKIIAGRPGDMKDTVSSLETFGKVVTF